MNALLVLTVGQTDVQFVDGNSRRELRKDACSALHSEISSRVSDWSLTDTPDVKAVPQVERLPVGPFTLCTPKLDAILRHLRETGIDVTSALILETRRDGRAEEPWFAGEILERKLRETVTLEVMRFPYITGRESYDDKRDPRDAVIRRTVVGRIDQVIASHLDRVHPARIVLATTGGIPPVNNLIEEVVRLHAPPGTVIDPLEVADGARSTPPTEDRAVPRRWIPEPAASFQARRLALSLVANGNLLGAWGGVQHLDADEVEHDWTRVIEWLACFASSMPMPSDCNIDLLKHPRRAVRSALRVELALKAGDIPQAVHGTVAFFESALWDHLDGHLNRHEDPKKRRQFKVDPAPDESLIRCGDGSKGDNERPFKLAEEQGGVRWFWVYDDDVNAIRLAKHYLKRPKLVALGQAVSKVRDLRNDVAHNEPTPLIMNEARRRMVDAGLWSESGSSFLSQKVVQEEMTDYSDIKDPASLTGSLIAEVRRRLVSPC